MTAANYNLTIEQGATWSLPITWTDQNNNPINLTNYTASMQIRSAIGGTVFASLNTTNGYVSLGGTAGTITLTLPPSVTSNMPPTTGGVYDLFLSTSGGTVTRLLTGTVTVVAAVTSS